MAMTEDDIAANDLRRFDTAQGNRGTWEAHWEEIAKRVFPSYAGSFINRGETTQGEKRTDEMVDPTAALALPKFAAAMESMLTPRNSTWHRLVPTDKTLQRNRTARMYFDDVNDILFRYRYAPNANYASQQHEAYMGLGAFGTAGLFVDKLQHFGERGLRYRAIHLGEIYFLENHQGIIDTALRKFDLTARQAYQRFGDSLPSDIIEKAKDATKCDTKFWFLHTVMPRSEAEGYDPERMDAKGMRYVSRYTSIHGKKRLQADGKEGGYNTFPYPISRYVVAPGETYGRSPAMLVLPGIKVLNEQKKTFLKQGHRTVDPVLLAYDDGVVDGFDLTPGAVNYGGMSAEGRPLIGTLPVGNLAMSEKMMEMERYAINDAFLVTLFQILVETPAMTATEVLERTREKGALLSPTMGRQQSEALGPMIERELDVLGSQGLLPPMPDIVRQAQADYDTIYDSPLSRAQRAEQGAGLMRLVGWGQEYAAVTGDVSPLDYIDWDAAMPDLADIQAVPSRWILDNKGVMAKRDARAQQAQQQQMIEAAPAAAGLMKAMPGAPGGA